MAQCPTLITLHIHFRNGTCYLEVNHSCIDRFKLLSIAGGLFFFKPTSCLKHLHHLGGEHTHLGGNLELLAIFFPTMVFVLLFMNFPSLNL